MDNAEDQPSLDRPVQASEVSVGPDLGIDATTHAVEEIPDFLLPVIHIAELPHGSDPALGQEVRRQVHAARAKVDAAKLNTAKLVMPTGFNDLGPKEWQPAIRDLLGTYRRASSALIGAGVRHLRIVIPLDSQSLIHSPGFFGQDDLEDEPTDTHWRLTQGAVVEDGGLLVQVTRRGKHLKVDLHTDGCHVVGRTHANGDRFVGEALGLCIRETKHKPIGPVTGEKVANPTTALALALTGVIARSPDDLPVTVWTHDNYLRAVINGEQSPMARPPQMTKSLLGLWEGIRSRSGSVQAIRAKKGGHTVRKISETTAALMIQEYGWRILPRCS
jgi:hypothetical protein